MPFPDTGGCQCGQIRYEIQAAPLTLYVCPGTLDNTSWLQPIAHLWTVSAQPWITLSDNISNILQQPTYEESAEIYKRFEKML